MYDKWICMQFKNKKIYFQRKKWMPFLSKIKKSALGILMVSLLLFGGLSHPHTNLQSRLQICSSPSPCSAHASKRSSWVSFTVSICSHLAAAEIRFLFSFFARLASPNSCDSVPVVCRRFLLHLYINLANKLTFRMNEVYFSDTTTCAYCCSSMTRVHFTTQDHHIHFYKQPGWSTASCIRLRACNPQRRVACVCVISAGPISDFCDSTSHNCTGIALRCFCSSHRPLMLSFLSNTLVLSW